MIVYDVTNRKSFENLGYWLNNIETHAGPEIQKILIANKCDLNFNRVVSPQEGQQFANQMGLKYIETSAKSNKNVSLAFENLTFDVFLQIENGVLAPDSDGSNGVKVGDYLMDAAPKKSITRLKRKKPEDSEDKKKCCG